MRSAATALLVVAATGLLAAGAAPSPPERAPDDLRLETLDAWRQLVCPGEAEQRWRAIPWRESFWHGVIDAQRQRKPVLLWAMNGHPMGCT